MLVYVSTEQNDTFDSIWNGIVAEKSIVANIKRRGPHEKNSALFPGPFMVQTIVSTVASIVAKIWYYWMRPLGALLLRWIFFPGAHLIFMFW